MRWARLVLLSLMATAACTSHAAGNWQLQQKENNLKVFTRPTESGYDAVRVTTTTDVPMARLLAVLTDVPRFPDWLSTVQTASVVSRQSPSHYKLYLAYHFPWPYQNRDVMTDERWTHDAKTGAMTLTFTEMQDSRALHKGLVHMTGVRGFWRLTPNSRGGIDIAYETHCNPGGSMPAWAFNMSSTSAIEGAVKNLVKVAADMPTPKKPSDLKVSLLNQ